MQTEMMLMIVKMVDVVGVTVIVMMVVIGSDCDVKLVDVNSWRC